MTREEAKRIIAVVLHAFGDQATPRQVRTPEGSISLRNVSFSGNVLSYTDDRAGKNIQAYKSGSRIDVNFGSERRALEFDFVVNGTVSTREGSFNIATGNVGINIDGYVYEVY